MARLLRPFEEAYEEDSRPGRVRRDLALGHREAPERNRASHVAGVEARLGGPVEQGGAVDPGPSARIGQPLAELERALVQGARLRVGAGDRGRVGGANGCVESGGEVARREQVVRQLGRSAGRRRAGEVRPLRQDPRQGGVEPNPLAGEEIVVDRLGQERVPEGKLPAGRFDDQECPIDRISQGAVQVGGRAVPRRLHQLHADRPSSGRDDAERPAGRSLDRPDARQEKVPQRRRKRRRRPGVGRDELLGEERVALRAAGDRLEERGRDRLAPDRPHEPGYLGPVEPIQLDATGAPASLELGEHGQERMPPVELVGPVRRQQQRPPMAEPPRQVGEELESGLVGPVDVLEHDDEGLGRPIEDAAHGLVHPAPAHGAGPGDLRARLEVRQQGGQVGAGGPEKLVGAVSQRLDQPSEGLDERRVRQEFGAEPHARADGNRRPARRRARCQLPDEPALADARLAAEKHHRALGAGGDRLLESAQLRLAADEEGAGAADAHRGTVASAAPRGKDRRLVGREGQGRGATLGRGRWGADARARAAGMRPTPAPD